VSLWGDPPASETEHDEAANALRLFDYLRVLVEQAGAGQASR
jgi:hypothetical protein